MLQGKFFACFKSKTFTSHSNSGGKSTFEYLPNELIFLIFDYLHCHEVIYAFINLNDRFQSLLSSYSSYHLNNSSELTKFKFELIQQLPFNIENVKYLTLFYKPDSIIDMDKFLSIYPLSEFYTKLKVLSLLSIKDFQASLIALLPNFQQLKSLSMSRIDSNNAYASCSDYSICQTILFKIKTLKYFKSNIKMKFVMNNSERSSTEISPIQYIELNRIHFDELLWYYEHTLTLKSICLNNFQFPYNQCRPQTFEQLVSLKMSDICSMDEIQWIFEHFQNLNQLKRLEFRGATFPKHKSINGYQLEYFIRQYVPQLKIFKFFFTINFIVQTLASIDELIRSFQTDFWLIEKQWFITCNKPNGIAKLYYYTQPCIENNLKYAYPWIEISTTTTQIDTSKINELTLGAIDSSSLKLLNHFMNINILRLSNISLDVTYEKLNRCVNLSTIKEFEWDRNTNTNLFFDILKHSSMELILLLRFDQLLRFTENQKTHFGIRHFKNIKSLTVIDAWCHIFKDKDIHNICSCFPNLKQFIFNTRLTSSQHNYIMGALQHLSYLEVNHTDDDAFNNRILIAPIKNDPEQKGCFPDRRTKRNIIYFT